MQIIDRKENYAKSYSTSKFSLVIDGFVANLILNGKFELKALFLMIA